MTSLTSPFWLYLYKYPYLKKRNIKLFFTSGTNILYSHCVILILVRYRTLFFPYHTQTFSKIYFLYICACLVASVMSNSLESDMDSSPPGSSVHGIFQARILEWVAISSSKGSSQPRDQTLVYCNGRWILYHLSQAKGFFKHVTQHSAMAFCLTKGSKPKSFQGPAGCRCPLLPTRASNHLLPPHLHPATLTPHCSLNTPDGSLLHGLRTWCSICLECSSPRYL